MAYLVDGRKERVVSDCVSAVRNMVGNTNLLTPLQFEDAFSEGGWLRAIIARGLEVGVEGDDKGSIYVRVEWTPLTEEDDTLCASCPPESKGDMVRLVNKGVVDVTRTRVAIVHHGDSPWTYLPNAGVACMFDEMPQVAVSAIDKALVALGDMMDPWRFAEPFSGPAWMAPTKCALEQARTIAGWAGKDEGEADKTRVGVSAALVNMAVRLLNTCGKADFYTDEMDVLVDACSAFNLSVGQIRPADTGS